MFTNVTNRTTFYILKHILYLVLLTRYSPIGIASLIAAKILDMDDPEVVFRQLGLYMVTVLVGLVIHTGCLMSLYFVFTRNNPLVFFRGMLQAWLTALATSSR